MLSGERHSGEQKESETPHLYEHREIILHLRATSADNWCKAKGLEPRGGWLQREGGLKPSAD